MMDESIIKDFLRDHLKIVIDNKTACVRVTLLIDKEVNSSSEVYLWK
jgi:flagellar motor component MotA